MKSNSSGELAGLKEFLDKKVVQYNSPGFITNDPVVIPHEYIKKQDIEIAGLISAVLAWGQRVTIIRKCREFLERMDHAPYAFVLDHQESDLKAFLDFKHRTFNATDALYFIAFLKSHYQQSDSLESAFIPLDVSGNIPVERALNHFSNYFFSLPNHPVRTYKHIPSPQKKSACKRLNMFLRWMVRKDNCGVDFGIWSSIVPAQLICPCDLHVDRVARRLKLISRKQTDWLTALELTESLRRLDPEDPVKYDFALFGLGIEEKYY